MVLVLTAAGLVLHNGSFVLLNSHGSVVWQTFDHPTNSLLSGQSLSYGMQLISCALETDLTRGIFRLNMQTDGNLVLYDLDSLDVPKDAYYASGTNKYTNVSLILETDGRLYLFDGASVLMNILTGGGYHALYLLRIDFDGIFRVYNRSLQPDDDWKPMWSVTEDKCLPKGLCGINSYCSYKDGNAADCRCLPGYDLVSSGGGCTSSLMVDCWEIRDERDSECIMGRQLLQCFKWEE